MAEDTHKEKTEKAQQGQSQKPTGEQRDEERPGETKKEIGTKENGRERKDPQETRFEEAKEQLKECLGTQKEYLEGWQRARAETANERRRFQNMLILKQQDTLIAFVRELLPVFDSYYECAKSVRKDTKNESLAQGLDGIHRQCLSALESVGGSVIDPTDAVFDPVRHEAVTTEKTDKEKDNRVLRVLRHGYTINDRVIRPAQVVVGRGDAV